MQREPALPRVGRILDVKMSCIDIEEKFDYVRRRDPVSDYVPADAPVLPFADDNFDAVVSIAALCFIEDWQRGISENVRVSSGRFVVGMINRHSLLWQEKGCNGGFRR